MTKPGTSSAGRQFFAVAPDWRFTTAAGFVIENEAKLLQGQPILGPEGDRRGFPPYPEPPKVVIDRKLGRPPTDFEQYSQCWLISDRLKRALEGIDVEACAFLKCEVRQAQGKPMADYWLFDVVRILDAVDESASRLGIVHDTRAPGGRYYRFSGGASLVFKPEVVGQAHLFGLTYARSAMFCDDALRQACKRAGVKGLSFTDAADLQ